MAKLDQPLELELTETGRKYGYIKWRKEHDEAINELLADQYKVNLLIDNGVLKTRVVERKYRRIGIGYSLTRHMPSKARIILKKGQKDKIEVHFSKV